VVKTDGSVETREVRIEVAAPPKPSAPIVTSVGTNPSGQIVLGACLQLYWDTQGDINRVSVTYNGQMIWDYAPVRGSMNHCPSSPGGTTYVVQASGPGGQAQGLAYVDVIQAQVQTQ
jgi:hypothetical protein